MIVRLPVILALLAHADTAEAQAARCLRYDRDTVALSGRVERRIYPGRPNYESIRDGDQPDTVYVLRLSAPLCTMASPDFEARTHVREVQLYFDREDVAGVRALRGRSTMLRGTLTGAVWGWHHLPVLFEIRLPPALPRRRMLQGAERAQPVKLTRRERRTDEPPPLPATRD
jgi:hypothetical protein